jgi:hypothetical protein
MSSPSSASAAHAAAAAPAITAVRSNVLQRQCECGQHTAGGGECEECKEKKTTLQRKSSIGANPRGVPPIVHEVLRRPGQPLDRQARAFFEPRFNRDFSQVRVHTDARAAESARAVSAHAYTVGSHIVFGSGQYLPARRDGVRLLAHELTHVVQQSHFQTSSRHALSVGDLEDEHEAQADSLASEIASGHTTRRSPLNVGQPRIQRLGVGHQILRFFGIESGKFSDDDLIEYLDRVARNKQCDCGLLDFFSDDKARQIANQGKVGGHSLDQPYKGLTSTDLKRILIQEMLSGYTGDADELAIIKILQDSDATQILEILNPAQGLAMQKLDSDISGNHDLLIQVLEQKLPDLGKQHLKRDAKPDEKSGACTADRALKIHQAHQRAETVVSHTLDLMDKYFQHPKEYQQVGRLLQCYFSGSDMKKSSLLRQDFQAMSAVLGKIQYVCPAKPFTQFKATDPSGKTTILPCEPDTQALSLQVVNTPTPQVLLCPEFFDMAPIEQARIAIHEAAHHIRVQIGDLDGAGYNPKCNQLKVDTAITNADSYAHFAMALENDGLQFEFDDCPQQWRDKITAASRTAQVWINAAIAKVDAAILNPRSPDKKTAYQLKRHFKVETTSEEGLYEVRRGLMKLQSGLADKLPFSCELNKEIGDEDLAGKVLVWPILGGGNIHLYRHWFEKLDHEEQAETIVHEMAHKYAGKSDIASYKEKFAIYMALQTEDLLDNADSYAQFSRYVQ